MAGERCYRDLTSSSDRLASREREVHFDLESGGTSSDEDRINDFVSENGQTQGSLSRFWDDSLYFDGWGDSGTVDENVELLKDKNSKRQDRQQQLMAVVNEKRKKKKNSRKPPKPPRPPKGPPLDAADQKLMQEIAELAMRKRARIERIKTLKKMRAGKVSSWCSSLSAIAITVVFCLVIIFQGISPRNSGSMMLEGSPGPAIAASEPLISIQFYKNFPSHESDEPGSGLPSSVAEGQVTGSGLRKK